MKRPSPCCRTKTIGLSVLALLVLTEVIGRLCGVHPQIPFFNTAGPLRADSKLHWAFQPNYDRAWSDIHFRTNSLGLRDDEIAVPKPAGEFRVLALGGSITAGGGLEAKDTFVEIAEAELRRLSGNPAISVINTGVPGYFPQQYIDFMRDTGLGLKPDVILLDFAANDVLEGRPDLVGEPSQKTKEERRPEFRSHDAFVRLGVPPMTASGRAYEEIRDIPRYFATYTMFLWGKRKIHHAMTGEESPNYFRMIEDEVVSETPSPRLEEGWRRTRLELGTLTSLAKDQGIPFVIVMFPLHRQVVADKGLDAPQRAMNTYCKENGLEFIDLLPAFRAHHHEKGKIDPLFHDADHPTARGHAIAGQMIAKELQARARPIAAR